MRAISLFTGSNPESITASGVSSPNYVIAFVALAAIAFGVGGRDLAAKKLEKWHEELKGKGRMFSEK